LLSVKSLLRRRVFVLPTTKSVPPPPLRGASGFASSGPDSHVAPRLRDSVLDGEGTSRRMTMAQVQTISAASDRVMAALISGLEIEFGRAAGEALAHRFLEAEEADFHWDARVQERWIGAYYDVDDDGFELDRVAILGRLDGQWFVATIIVDGEGNAHGMLGQRAFGSRAAAKEAFDGAH
jgi:hypothetical protein